MQKSLLPLSIVVYMGLGFFLMFGVALNQQNLPGDNELGIAIGLVLGLCGVIILAKAAHPLLFVLLSVSSVFFLFFNYIAYTDAGNMSVPISLVIVSVLILFPTYALVMHRSHVHSK